MGAGAVKRRYCGKSALIDLLGLIAILIVWVGLSVKAFGNPVVPSAKTEPSSLASIIGVLDPSNQKQLHSIRVGLAAPDEMAAVRKRDIVFGGEFLYGSRWEAQDTTIPWRDPKLIGERLNVSTTIRSWRSGRYYHLGISAPQYGVAFPDVEYEERSLHRAGGTEGRLSEAHEFDIQFRPMGYRIGDSHILRLLAVNENLDASNYYQAEGKGGEQPISDACSQESVIRRRGIACILSLIAVCASWSFGFRCGWAGWSIVGLTYLFFAGTLILLCLSGDRLTWGWWL